MNNRKLRYLTLAVMDGTMIVVDHSATKKAAIQIAKLQIARGRYSSAIVTWYRDGEAQQYRVHA